MPFFKEYNQYLFNCSSNENEGGTKANKKVIIKHVRKFFIIFFKFKFAIFMYLFSRVCFTSKRQVQYVDKPKKKHKK